MAAGAWDCLPTYLPIYLLVSPAYHHPSNLTPNTISLLHTHAPFLPLFLLPGLLYHHTMPTAYIFLLQVII